MANSKGNRRRFGSVRKLASGRWQARYRDPLTGQLRAAKETFETKTDADIALTLIEADISRDKWTDPDADKANFGEFATAWLKDRKSAGCRSGIADGPRPPESGGTLQWQAVR
jgi:hypothetical protein